METRFNDTIKRKRGQVISARAAVLPVGAQAGHL